MTNSGGFKNSRSSAKKEDTPLSGRPNNVKKQEEKKAYDLR